MINDTTQARRHTQLHSRAGSLCLRFLLVPIVIATLGYLPQAAIAQGPDSLSAHLGFLARKPKTFPLPNLELFINNGRGTGHHTTRVPRDTTGITLLVRGVHSSRATLERHHAGDGKKLKSRSWSTEESSTQLHILSFDGLKTGENTIQFSIDVRKEPGLSETHTLVVERAEALGSDATLARVSLSESDLTPAFASDVRSYEANVPYEVTSISIAAQGREAGTAIDLQGIAPDGAELVVEDVTAAGLKVGRNRLKILTVSEDGSTTDSYTVAVARDPPSTDTRLFDLSLAEGAEIATQGSGLEGLFALLTGFDVPTGGGILRPGFSPETRSYEAAVPRDVTGVRLAIIAANISTVRQIGKAPDGTPLQLAGGAVPNSLTVNDDGSAISSWREGTFKGLTIGNRTVRNGFRRVVAFTGLQFGENTLEVHVTAQDGVTRGTYTVTVTRED